MPASDSVYHSNQQFAYTLPDHNSKTCDYPAESTIYSEGDFYSVEFPNTGNTWRVRTQEVTYNAKHRIGNHTALEAVFSGTTNLLAVYREVPLYTKYYDSIQFVVMASETSVKFSLLRGSYAGCSDSFCS